MRDYRNDPRAAALLGEQPPVDLAKLRDRPIVEIGSLTRLGELAGTT